jgi:hypothetical protein
MAVRNQTKAAEAVEQIRTETAEASLELVELDLRRYRSRRQPNRSWPGMR